MNFGVPPYPARRPVGRYLLLAVILLALALPGARWLASPAGQDTLLAPRLAWMRATAGRQPGRYRSFFESTLMHKLARAGIDTSLAQVDWAPASPAGAISGRWEVPLPQGYPTSRANAVITRVVESFGGHVLDGHEQAGNQVFLTAEVVPGLSIDALLMGKVKPRGGAPRLALLIDRFGFRNLAESQALIDVGRGMTAAIVPYTTGARGLADRCRSAGLEVIVSLPMEGLNYPSVNPGPGAVLVDLTPPEIRRRVASACDALGGAGGAVTFLGALAVEDRTVMQAVLGEVARRHAYFVDTTKSQYSVVRDVAAQVGVPSIRVSDNIDGPSAGAAAVERNLKALAEQARSRGAAIGLIHPYPGTVTALKALLPEWRSAGIELVPVSEVVTVPGE